MRLVTWEKYTHDPDSYSGTHDIQCDSVELRGVVLVVRKKKPVGYSEHAEVVTHYIRDWDYAEIDPDYSTENPDK